MKEYKGIIDEIVKNNLYEVLIIDVTLDKIYKYKIKNNDYVLDTELSYQEYLSNCKDFIEEDDIDNYIDSLSISKLESTNERINLEYKMKDEMGNYIPFSSNIMLYEEDGKKVIVVLTNKDITNKELKNRISSKSNIEVKLKKMTDSVGLAFLKIHIFRFLRIFVLYPIIINEMKNKKSACNFAFFLIRYIGETR